MKKRMSLILITVGLLGLGMDGHSKEEGKRGLIAWWKLEKATEGKIWEEMGKIEDSIRGNYSIVKGVSGQAIRFDGFTSLITRKAADFPGFGQEFSVDAWVAPGAYPWNWCPVVAQSQDEKAGFFFGVGPRGEVGLGLSLDGRWEKLTSEERIPLRKWSHIAATFSQDKGLRLYLNGELVQEKFVSGTPLQAREANLVIGMNSEKIVPSDPVRPQATLPALFSFDGVIDEIRIFNRALEEEEIKGIYESPGALPQPDIPPRILPAGRTGPGRFGAYYTKLKYYEEWDALWRVGDYADVVVEFDHSPIRVVFWRGTRYSPVWVMENGQWMADQSAESFTKEDGCFEHMLDAKCLYSHVRIIENTGARVVVHWRYIPVSVRQKFSQVDEITGWPDAVDEYYSFYPDGIGIRKVVMFTSGKPLGPQETIILCQPGSRPEDNVNLDAITLVNLKGESQVYSWAEGPPRLDPKKPENPIIQVVNLKSTAKPFLIFEKGCRMRVFGIEVRDNVSPFPWWNHWPVAQIPSDGRYSQAPDRASHFSLAWGGPPIHKGEGLEYWAAWVYGTTVDRPEKLISLARSWINAPPLSVTAGSYENLGYDLSQRAYVVLNRNPEKPSALQALIAASEESPVSNLCLLLKKWGEAKVRVTVDGVAQKEGEALRLGLARKMEGSDLVLWIDKKSTKPVRIEIGPE